MSSLDEDDKIIIQGVTEDSITIDVNGKSQEIEKKLDALLVFMKKLSSKSVQTADKIYNIGTITHANFDFLMGKAQYDKSLPVTLSENLVGEGDEWIKGLVKALLREGIPVGDDPTEVFKSYDWLIQVFLLKMRTPPGQEKTTYGLSFMVEAYQASLRYLCYIQVAQVLVMEDKPKRDIISAFIQMGDDEYKDFDYSSLLFETTDLLGDTGFVREVNKFVKDLKDTNSDLFRTACFLDTQRRNLLSGSIEKDDAFSELLEKYLTALVFWLKNLSFLANYRLVSIKDINLNYRIGSDETYLHRYGELYGIYNDGRVADITKSIQVKGSFTYSKSILLFKGNVLASCLRNIDDKTAYISLTPLLLDKSVYDDEDKKQTPEVYYFTGYQKGKRQYNYSPFNKELDLDKENDNTLYPTLEVKSTNTDLAGLDDLFEQLEEMLNPFKIRKS